MLTPSPNFRSRTKPSADGTPTPTLAPPRSSHIPALLLIALFSLPLVLLLLGSGDPVDMMELFNLIPVREAFRDHHWLMPTLNGIPRLEKPPLPVWLPAALATLFNSDSLWVTRFPSALMAVLTAFATYGIGVTLSRGRMLGISAALILSATVVFNRHARLASYDIFATAFATCSILFLLRLFETTNRRWRNAIFAGAAAGLSILSKGPVPMATVLIPFVLWIIFFHRQKIPRAIPPLLVALAVALLTFLPWLVVIGLTVPEAWPVWRGELLQFLTGKLRGEKDLPELHASRFYYLQMLYWTAPFIPLFIGGLVLPFLPIQSDPSPSPRESRGRWFFWLALVIGLLLLSVPSEKKPRYALQLFPYAALLCAAVWQEFSRLCRTRKLDPPARFLLITQGATFLGAAIALPAFLLVAATGFPASLYRLLNPILISFPLAWSTGIAYLFLAALLFASAAALWQQQFSRQFDRALVSLLLSSFLLCFTWTLLYRSIPSTHTNANRPHMRNILDITGNGPIYTLADYRPWLPTLYFANQILPATTDDQLAIRILSAPADVYLIAPTDAATTARINALSATTHRAVITAYTFNDEHQDLALYRFATGK